jgi:hypothetical protein
MQEMAMKMKSKGYMAGGKTKGYKAGGKMKMVEKDGKKVPFFAADGQGKMAKGGKVPTTKGYFRGGKVMGSKGMAKGGVVRGSGAARKQNFTRNG